MAYFNNKDRVRFLATASGIAPYTIGSPASPPFFTPAGAGMAVGDWGTYLAQSSNGTTWELFEAQLQSGNQLSRTFVASSTGALINWTNGESIIVSGVQHARRALTAGQEGRANPANMPTMVTGQNADWFGSHMLRQTRTYFTDIGLIPGTKIALINGYARLEHNNTTPTAYRLSMSLSDFADTSVIYTTTLTENSISNQQGRFALVPFQEILFLPAVGVGTQTYRLRFFAEQLSNNVTDLMLYRYRVTGTYFLEGAGA